MPRINKSQYAILGCLSIKPQSAYEIKTLMERSTDFFWSEREGQLYPTLKMLVDKKFVSYIEEPAQKSGLKKIYSITELGKKEFDAWFCKETSPTIERNELLLKVFFARSQPKSNNISLLQEALDRFRQKLQKLNELKTYLKTRQQEGVNVTYYSMTLEHGIEVTHAEILWCEKMIKQLQISKNN